MRQFSVLLVNGPTRNNCDSAHRGQTKYRRYAAASRLAQPLVRGATMELRLQSRGYILLLLRFCLSTGIEAYGEIDYAYQQKCRNIRCERFDSRRPLITYLWVRKACALCARRIASVGLRLTLSLSLLHRGVMYCDTFLGNGDSPAFHF